MTTSPLDVLKAEFDRVFTPEADLYTALNAYRDWFNPKFANAEIYLEDNWFTDKTTIEYTLRSLDTLDFVILAEDEYDNFIADGTIQLGPYRSSHWVVPAPWAEIERFFSRNPLPQQRTPV